MSGSDPMNPADPLGAPRDPETEEPSEQPSTDDPSTDPLDPELPADPDISPSDA